MAEGGDGISNLEAKAPQLVIVNRGQEETKTPKATESNLSEVELGTSSFFRVLGTMASPSNASNTLTSNNFFHRNS